MRTFVGIDLDDTWRDALSAVCQAVREVEPSWREDRWVPIDNLHLTLKFFGDMQPDTLDSLGEDLAAACVGVTPFALPLDQPVMAVPQARRASMLWSSFADPEGRCAALASITESVSAVYGVPPESRQFRPHVTLVRARRPRKLGHGRQVAESALAAHLVGEPPLRVFSVTLFTSKLTRSGAVYDRIRSIPLNTR